MSVASQTHHRSDEVEGAVTNGDVVVLEAVQNQVLVL